MLPPVIRQLVLLPGGGAVGTVQEPGRAKSHAAPLAGGVPDQTSELPASQSSVVTL